jgi:hypothetical protein
MSSQVIADKDKLQNRTISVSGLVAAVDSGQIILNVERVTKEIKDPSTAQVIRRMSTPVGVLKVTDVDDASSVATRFQVPDSKWVMQ